MSAIQVVADLRFMIIDKPIGEGTYATVFKVGIFILAIQSVYYCRLPGTVEDYKRNRRFKGDTSRRRRRDAVNSYP